MAILATPGLRAWKRIMTRAATATPPLAPLEADEPVRLVAFRVDEYRFALPLAAVERVIHAVALTALPKAPAVVLGLIDVQGDVLPVCDLRERLQIPRRPIRVTDHLVIARTRRRRLALLVDLAEGVCERAAEAIIGADHLDSGLEQLSGIVRLDDGLVLIHDLERFLSTAETRALDEALQAELSTEASRGC